MNSHWEQYFATLWSSLVPDAPAPIPQHQFAPPRRWRADFAWPEQKVMLEIHGGEFVGGRHTRGAGMARDFEKHNAAVAAGWRVFYVTGKMLENDPYGVVDMVHRAVRRG